MRAPYVRYRPTYTPDGQGGWNTALADGITIYGEAELHEGELRITVDAKEDIEVEDVLVFEET